MNHQRGRAELFDEQAGGPSTVHIEGVPGRSRKFPEGEPQLFGLGHFAAQVEDAVVRNQRLEPIGVAEHPVDHIAAVRGAGRGHAIGIDVGKSGGVIGRSHQVVEGPAAPVAVDLVDELLAIACGPANVRQDDDVPRRGEHLHVPAIAPVFAPGALRAAVDQNQRRIFPVRIEIRRLHDEPLHARLLRAFYPEFYERSHLMAVQQGVVQMGQRRRSAAGGRGLEDLHRMRSVLLGVDHGLAILAELHVIEVAVTAHGDAGRAPGHRQKLNGLPSAVFGGEKKPR